MEPYVFYGGKGGVGKTTCAAATGLAFAGRGERTLVLSTDPAHSLADAFGTEPASGRQRVADDLWVEEVGPEAGERAFRGLVESVATELRSAGIRLGDEDIERLFAAGVAPGSDELAALERLGAGLDAEFDRVVVDTAPTGHTLRLLDLPDVLRETLAAAESLRGQVRRMVDTARGAVFGPAYYVFGRDGDDDEVAALADRMERVRTLLRDGDRSTFRVVTVPEPMAVAETRRLVAQLRDGDVPVDAVVVNRVLEDPDPECARCRARAATHEDQLAELRAAFADLETVVLPEAAPDADPREALSALGPLLVGEGA